MWYRNGLDGKEKRCDSQQNSAIIMYLLISVKFTLNSQEDKKSLYFNFL